MREKEYKARIKELEGQLQTLVERIPSKYLLERAKGYTSEHTKQWTDWSDDYRKKENKRISKDRRWNGEDRRQDNRRSEGEQLELFEPNDVY